MTTLAKGCQFSSFRVAVPALIPSVFAEKRNEHIALMDSGTSPQAQPPVEKPPPWTTGQWKQGLIDLTKLSFLVVFGLYASGFIIWHSYLGSFGVSTVEFLQAEYLAAGVCYLVLFIVIGAPLLIYYEIVIPRMLTEKFNFQTGMFWLFAIIWFYLLRCVTWLYFSDGVSTLSLSSLIIFSSVGAVHVTAINIAARKTSLEKNLIYKFFASGNWVAAYLIFAGILHFSANSLVNQNFVASCFSIYVVNWVASGGVTLREISFVKTFRNHHPSLKVLLIVLGCLILINSINCFGTEQFRSIPKTVGGGRPEKKSLTHS